MPAISFRDSGYFPIARIWLSDSILRKPANLQERKKFKMNATQNEKNSKATNSQTPDILNDAAKSVTVKIESLKSGLESTGISTLIAVDREYSKIQKSVTRVMTSTLFDDNVKSVVGSRYAALIAKIF
jgi:hypothetical protein